MNGLYSPSLPHWLDRPTAAVVGVTVATALMLGGCDLLSSSSETTGTVHFAMETSSSETGSGTSKRAETSELSISGSNGTLTLTSLHLIVDEFELERSDEEDDGEEVEDDEVEQGPYLTGLDLEGSPVRVTSGTVPYGRYEELSFEIEDVDFDDEEDGDDENDQSEAALRSAIENAGYADWPADASMVAVGTFTPTDGEARPFTTYFEAEIEIEVEMDPPLDLQEGDPSPRVTVQLDPERWFTRADGRVRDLSAFDYGESGELVEFELEIENGFAETEIEQEFGD